MAGEDKRRLQRHIEDELRRQLLLPLDEERQLPFQFMQLTEPLRPDEELKR